MRIQTSLMLRSSFQRNCGCMRYVLQPVCLRRIDAYNLPRANHISPAEHAIRRLRIEPLATSIGLEFVHPGVLLVPYTHPLETTTTHMMPGKLTVLKHPVVNSRIADLRQTGTSPKEFRQVSPTLSLLQVVHSIFAFGGAGELFS